MDGGWWGEIMSEGQHSAPNMIRPEWDNPQRPRRPTEAPPNTANSPSHKYGSELKHNHQSSQIEGEKGLHGLTDLVIFKQLVGIPTASELATEI